MDAITRIPSKMDAQEIIQSIAQQGSGFTTNTPYIPIKPKREDDRRATLLNKLISDGHSTEKANEMVDAYVKGVKP
jgi:hypothetical protein